MRKIFGIMVVVLLAGCGGQEAGVTTSTNSPVPKITKTPTFTFTRTATSTGTLAVIETSTKTPFPYPTPLGGWLMEISPNGEWGVWNIPVGVCGDKLIIMNILDENLLWEVSYQVTDELLGTIDLGAHLEHWSEDGQYLYFITDIGCIDGGPAFQGVLSFRRLNLVTGNIINILTPGGINAKISPNSQYLAFINMSRFTVRDLSTGKEKSIVVVVPNSTSRGDIHWSPDSTKLVYVIETKDDEFSKFMYSLVFVDTIKMEHKTLIKEFQEEGRNYWIVWEDNETITLSIPSKTMVTILSINTTTGEITEEEE